MKHLIIACVGCLWAVVAWGQSKSDPATWILWRAAPIDFPEVITPQVPELMHGPPPIDFGADGSQLTIVMPPDLRDDHASRALDWVRRYVVNKVPKAKSVTPTELTDQHWRQHLLVLGTVANNPLAQTLLGADADRWTMDLRPGGYRIEAIAHPRHADRRVILALGRDLQGAYSAGAVLCHAIHPNKEGVKTLQNWPVEIPSGCYWLPFTATASPQTLQIPQPPSPAPPKPTVPFGFRVWGSPMPTLTSYQRLVRALKPTGINTIVVQSGGWVDLPNAAEVFSQALDIAWSEGLYTCLYVGNEEEGHRSAPLTPNHKAVILATKDHPGLLAFHLYNQLGTKDSPEQYRDLESQVRWINSITDKPTSIEIVWGHNIAPIPPDKVQLMRDVKAWGLDIIGTDYAPIGGWSDQPFMPRWEAKLLALRPLEDKTEVLLQAHVPFLGATIPSPAQVRNQFWWAAAGGARGYFVEVSYLFTHFNMRGMVSWDFRPLPDGRYDAVREIVGHAQLISEFITAATILTPEQADALGIRLVEASPKLHLRLRTLPTGDVYVLIINEELTKPMAGRLTTTVNRHQVTDVLTQKDRGLLTADRKMIVTAPAGGSVCLKLHPVTP